MPVRQDCWWRGSLGTKLTLCAGCWSCMCLARAQMTEGGKLLGSMAGYLRGSGVVVLLKFGRYFCGTIDSLLSAVCVCVCVCGGSANCCAFL
ncbi:uncharacterized protein B0I36DRAFT_320336 [Microdochium trichocladiopsis]|uniref:Uncharacterized protein n=1 Tax=Microdochium trichocladiopsis TaxID=1682393 RepID=A0A9P8Y835_9PEZI|nr:uncharacterized protein B0I36DRAFT_320336 [Microdochium trichocladiopsis]KAH7032914.1 hypothetical protein B0I36DRAFT_320336 [Microdochium trichocladiopsis]